MLYTERAMTDTLRDHLRKAGKAGGLADSEAQKAARAKNLEAARLKRWPVQNSQTSDNTASK